MNIPKIIKIKEGTNGFKDYFLFDEYNTEEEATKVAKEIREERMREYKIRWKLWFYDEGTLLRVPKVALYLNRRIKF
jgi:hypothetical protein